jgi:hypothetical protein
MSNEQDRFHSNPSGFIVTNQPVCSNGVGGTLLLHSALL